MLSQSLKNYLTEEEFEKRCSLIENPLFIQIGANDGISVDPIHHLVVQYNWTGILFEPGPEAFKVLSKTYEDRNNLRLVNAAVSDRDGSIILYCGTTTPHFTVDFNKAKHMFDVEPKPIEVKCFSMKTILDTYIINGKLDILQIDAEGHDHIILNNFDFTKSRPSIIRFEHVSIDSRDLENCLTILTEFNYEIFYSTDGADVIAVQRAL